MSGCAHSLRKILTIRHHPSNTLSSRATAAPSHDGTVTDRPELCTKFLSLSEQSTRVPPSGTMCVGKIALVISHYDLALCSVGKKKDQWGLKQEESQKNKGIKW